MTPAAFEVVWDEIAVNSAAGFLADDPAGLTGLLEAIDELARNPRPSSSTFLASAGLRRLRAGRYRVLYEVAEVESRVTVIHVGRRR